MRRRVYGVLPDLPSARRTMDDLLLARIGESHIHFIAREGMDLKDLHAANLLQTSDVIRAAQAGILIGGGTGALLGSVLALWVPIVGDDPQWGAMAVLTVMGALLGAWFSSMIGISTPSQRLKRFAREIDQGQLLLMVDVPRSRVDEIETLLRRRHPEMGLAGLEPHIPAFP